MSKPNKTQAEVAAFIAACNQHGFNYEVSNNVVRISKRFTPGWPKVNRKVAVDSGGSNIPLYLLTLDIAPPHMLPWPSGIAAPRKACQRRHLRT